MREKGNLNGVKTPTASKVLYIAASVVTLIGAALLVNNIILYNRIVAQYLAQGYPADEVIKQFVSTQLLPGIFEPVAVYGGIAAALFGLGTINKRIAGYLLSPAGNDTCNCTEEEVINSTEEVIIEGNQDEEKPVIEGDQG